MSVFSVCSIFRPFHHRAHIHIWIQRFRKKVDISRSTVDTQNTITHCMKRAHFRMQTMLPFATSTHICYLLIWFGCIEVLSNPLWTVACLFNYLKLMRNKLGSCMIPSNQRFYYSKFSHLSQFVQLIVMMNSVETWCKYANRSLKICYHFEYLIRLSAIN